ncbi:hypothetical protein Pcinc_011333 [Petrolisthes cinctipes]|uniref:Protein CNPPD1 n=1 Tax=Petrolisthes cinctipes TaxID=88211 RepID=A0AAE1G2X5_PETCI|nr:hypothetical protein Pcinc_011333 [Petrolisthes cinctipes]
MGTPKTPDKLNYSQFSKFLPEYLSYAERIRKTLYYGRLPSTDRPSLPFTSLCVEKFSGACLRGGLEVLDVRTAATLSYHACPTPASLVIALLYLDRLSPCYLAATPPSRVFLVAMMVASKYLYDDGEEDEVFNDEWATSAAITLQDLNQAELEFLSAIDWNLFVDGEAFLRTFERVEADVAWREGVKRGYFTYTDLHSLSKSLPHCYTTFLNLVSHVVAVCLVGYTAAVVSIVAGTVLAQECRQQVSSAINQMGYYTTTLDQSLAPYPDDQLPSLPLDHINDSIHSLADTVSVNLEEDESSNNTSFQGLPSRAITTLTTSILLAMSSPSSHHKPEQETERCRDCRKSGREQLGGTCQPDVHCDPSDVRITFTTGSYWLPSSFSRGPNGYAVNPMLPEDLPTPRDVVNVQKEDWVYSNPWVIPWLAWHSAPIYSSIHNFSGIGASNVGSLTGREDGWMEEWVGWVASSVLSAVADLVPQPTLQTHFPPPSVFTRVAVTPSTPNQVPLML